MNVNVCTPKEKKGKEYMKKENKMERSLGTSSQSERKGNEFLRQIINGPDNSIYSELENYGPFVLPKRV